jgi:hypothetical protein
MSFPPLLVTVQSLPRAFPTSYMYPSTSLSVRFVGVMSFVIVTVSPDRAVLIPVPPDSVIPIPLVAPPLSAVMVLISLLVLPSTSETVSSFYTDVYAGIHITCAINITNHLQSLLRVTCTDTNITYYICCE